MDIKFHETLTSLLCEILMVSILKAQKMVNAVNTLIKRNDLFFSFFYDTIQNYDRQYATNMNGVLYIYVIII